MNVRLLHMPCTQQHYVHIQQNHKWWCKDCGKEGRKVLALESRKSRRGKILTTKRSYFVGLVPTYTVNTHQTVDDRNIDVKQE